MTEQAAPPPRAAKAPARASRKPRGKAASGRKGARPKRTLVRWSKEREGRFLETLAQTGNVAESARVSGLSDSTVYRRRAASEAFRARWTVALREGFVKLETMMLERALRGVEKPVFHQGKQVATITEYDNRTCLALLSAHRGTVMGTTPEGPALPEAEMRAALSTRLSEMNRNMGGDG